VIVPISTVSIDNIIKSLPEQWLTKHKCENSSSSSGENQKNIFYNKKVVIPISTATIATILLSIFQIRLVLAKEAF